MNPLPSARHHAALSARTAFVRVVNVTFTRGAMSLTVEPESATFTQDGRRSMRWSGEVTITTLDHLPKSPADILTPFGTRASVDLGVELADGTQSIVPFGRYIVDTSSVEIASGSATATLPLIDLADAVAGYRFETPFTVPAGVDVADAINMVIAARTGTDPNLTATGVTLARARVFGLEPQDDPWRELVDLAAGFGLRLYYDRAGNLTLDVPPDPTGNPVAVHGAMTVAGAWEKRPPNVIVARGEASDSTPPVQAVAMDDDPSSPTYAGTAPGSSPYGRITEYFASPLITTVNQAQSAARSRLAARAGAGASWTVTRPFDPTWDPDDVIAPCIDCSGLDTELTLIADSITVDANGETTLECRSPSTLSDP